MSKWTMVRLGDVSDILNGFAFESNKFSKDSKYIPIIRIRDVLRGWSNTFYSGEYDPKYLISKGDLLIGMDGEFNISEWKRGEALLNQRVCKIIADNTILHTKYLYYFLPKALKEIEDKTPFVTVKHLSAKSIESISLPLPPLDEQKRIADVLDKASELIKKRKEQIRLMDELAKSLFIEMFGDPVENPMGWDVKKLGDLLSDSPQNGLYKPLSSYANGNDGTPILRIDAFYDGKITDLSQLKRLHCNENEKKLYSLEEGDIVINRVNSMDYLGKCAYIPGLCEITVFESNMMRLQIQRDILHPRYAVFLLCSKFIQRQIMSHAKKAVNQASINQTDVMDFDFHLPPLPLQNEFADRIDAIEQQKALLQNGLAKMETAYKALMQEYFG